MEQSRICQKEGSVIPDEEILQRLQGWTSFSKELPGMVLEIERSIFKELVDEVVHVASSKDAGGASNPRTWPPEGRRPRTEDQSPADRLTNYSAVVRVRARPEAMGIATMHEIRSLRLVHNNLTNQGLTAILDNCRHLESLEIRNCCNIVTDDALRAKCAHIKSLKLPIPSPISPPRRLNSLLLPLARPSKPFGPAHERSPPARLLPLTPARRHAGPTRQLLLLPPAPLYKRRHPLARPLPKTLAATEPYTASPPRNPSSSAAAANSSPRRPIVDETPSRSFARYRGARRAPNPPSLSLCSACASSPSIPPPPPRNPRAQPPKRVPRSFLSLPGQMRRALEFRSPVSANSGEVPRCSALQSTVAVRLDLNGLDPIRTRSTVDPWTATATSADVIPQPRPGIDEPFEFADDPVSEEQVQQQFIEEGKYNTDNP
nr:unnamed protein product [Digitaria exilis]